MSEQVGQLEPLDLPEKKEYTHRAHRFPGKFHPPLIAKVLEDHPEHDVVADPMCGSGTMGVEAVTTGKEALCVDIDPLCALMALAKATPVEPEAFLETGQNILERAGPLPEKGSIETEEIARAEVEERLKGTPFCIPYNLSHWFDPYVAVGYARLLEQAHDVLQDEKQDMDDAVRMALASIVRHISRADPQPVSGLEVTSVRKKELENGLEFDVASRYRQALKRIANGYRDLLKVDGRGEVEVRRADAREFSAVCSEANMRPSMVVTSPPYCNAIEYSRRHRLEYEWLGLFNYEGVSDPRNERIETSRDYIGSRTTLQETLEELDEAPHEEIEQLLSNIEKENETKANLLREYFLDAYDWIDQVYKALPEHGLFVLIIGPSTSYGHTVNTPKFLSDIAQETGFVVESEQAYKLKNNKMQYPTDGATTEMEKLIHFRK